MFRHDMFSNIPPIGQIYFLYGLAFFFLAISIVLKETKESDLKLAGSLWLLAGFGFTHGAHEWLDLYRILQEQYLSVTALLWFNLIQLFTVTISFLFLLEFGLSLIRSLSNNRREWLSGVPAILFLVWFIYLWKHGFSMDTEFFKNAYMSARYAFGFVGGVVTAYGLMRSSRDAETLSRSVSKKFSYAGISFAFYGIFAGLIPSHSVLPYFQIPIEVLRAISTVFITYFIIRALNIFDIETKRKLERKLKRIAQSEKLGSLGKLAAGIAHDINNPLANISINIELLRDRLKGINNPDTMERLDAIEQNIRKASTTARELLQFARKTETDMRPLININTVITGALELMQYEFKDIVVHQNLSDVPDILGDPERLERCFVHILENSVEAIPDAGEIRIESVCDGGWITIKIADSGIGIPQEDLSKVFDPFFSTKELNMGTGLGLSICYSIISQHRGDIDIESREGEGTVVTVRLPTVGKKI